MSLLNDTTLAIIAIAYGIGVLALLIYTDYLSKQIKRHEELEKERRQAHLAEYHSGVDEDLKPLVGVIYPPKHGYGRRHGKR